MAHSDLEAALLPSIEMNQGAYCFSPPGGTFLQISLIPSYLLLLLFLKCFEQVIHMKIKFSFHCGPSQGPSLLQFLIVACGEGPYILTPRI